MRTRNTALTLRLCAIFGLGILSVYEGPNLISTSFAQDTALIPIEKKITKVSIAPVDKTRGWSSAQLTYEFLPNKAGTAAKKQVKFKVGDWMATAEVSPETPGYPEPKVLAQMFATQLASSGLESSSSTFKSISAAIGDLGDSNVNDRTKLDTDRGAHAKYADEMAANIKTNLEIDNGNKADQRRRVARDALSATFNVSNIMCCGSKDLSDYLNELGTSAEEFCGQTAPLNAAQLSGRATELRDPGQQLGCKDGTQFCFGAVKCVYKMGAAGALPLQGEVACALTFEDDQQACGADVASKCARENLKIREGRGIAKVLGTRLSPDAGKPVLVPSEAR